MGFAPAFPSPVGGVCGFRGLQETHRGAGGTPRSGEALRGAGDPLGNGGILKGVKRYREDWGFPEGAVEPHKGAEGNWGGN